MPHQRMDRLLAASSRKYIPAGHGGVLMASAPASGQRPRLWRPHRVRWGGPVSTLATRKVREVRDEEICVVSQAASWSACPTSGAPDDSAPTWAETGVSCWEPGYIDNVGHDVMVWSRCRRVLVWDGIANNGCRYSDADLAAPDWILKPASNSAAPQPSEWPYWWPSVQAYAPPFVRDARPGYGSEPWQPLEPGERCVYVPGAAYYLHFQRYDECTEAASIVGHLDGRKAFLDILHATGRAAPKGCKHRLALHADVVWFRVQEITSDQSNAFGERVTGRVTLAEGLADVVGFWVVEEGCGTGK